MKKWTALGRAVAWRYRVVRCGSARRNPPMPAPVPGYLLFGDSRAGPRQRGCHQGQDRSTSWCWARHRPRLPGPDGAKTAYPARLEAALARRLPGVKVTVATLTQTAPDRRGNGRKHSSKLLLDEKPSLVVWQTGTFDAMRGVDPDEFRASVC